MRRFEMHRHNDVSGISGTGVVAEGVLFDDNSAVIKWKSDKPSTVIWQNFDHAISVHSHNGGTEFVFLDKENN